MDRGEQIEVSGKTGVENGKQEVGRGVWRMSRLEWGEKSGECCEWNEKRAEGRKKKGLGIGNWDKGSGNSGAGRGEREEGS